MGRGYILVLGGLVVMWTWLACRAYLPDKAIGLTIVAAGGPAFMAVKLFLECKCDKKTEPDQTKS